MELESFRILREIDSLFEEKKIKMQAIAQEESRVKKISNRKNNALHELEEFDTQLREAKKQEHIYTLKIDQLTELLSKMQEDLKNVTHNQQLIVLERQIEKFKDEKQDCENKSFSLLEHIETLEIKHLEIKDFLQGLDETITEIKNEVELECKEMTRQLSVIEQRVASLQKQLPPKLQTVQSQLIHSNKTPSTTTLQGFDCNHCGISLSKKDEMELENYYDLKLCRGCGRIILPQTVYR